MAKNGSGPRLDDASPDRSDEEGHSDFIRTPAAKSSPYHEAVTFLELLRPGGPWLLIAIDPTKEEGERGQIEADTVRNADEIREFIATYIGRCNLYYSVNPTRTAMRKKPTKADIARIEYLPGDLDPNSNEAPTDAKARYREGLKTFAPPPTAIIDSGNGINALWRLAEPIVLSMPVRDEKKKKWKYPPEVAEAEGRSKAIMEALGSEAGTQNIDRILRLPGTINIPTKAKKAKGRVECPTALISFNDKAYALDDFPEPKTKPKAERKAKEPGEKKPLDNELINLLYLPNAKPCGPYKEGRNAALWAFLKKAIWKGVDDNDMLDALQDPRYKGYGIYEHCVENGGEDYIKKQIEKALDDSEPAASEDRKIVILIKGRRPPRHRQEN